MNSMNRLVRPKHLALLIWSVFFGLIVAAAAILQLMSGKGVRAFAEVEQAEPSGAEGAIEKAGRDMSSIAGRMANGSNGSLAGPIFLGLTEGQTPRNPLVVSGLIIVQGAGSATAVLNGQPIKTGMRLAGGEVVTRIDRRSVTLLTPEGGKVVLNMESAFKAQQSLPLGDVKK